MNYTTFYNGSTNSVTISIAEGSGSWLPVVVPAGGSFILGDGMALSDGLETVAGGSVRSVIMTDSNVLAVSAPVPSAVRSYLDGFAVGIPIAASVLALWIIGLMRRGVVER